MPNPTKPQKHKRTLLDEQSSNPEHCKPVECWCYSDSTDAVYLSDVTWIIDAPENQRFRYHTLIGSECYESNDLQEIECELAEWMLENEIDIPNDMATFTTRKNQDQ